MKTQMIQIKQEQIEQNEALKIAGQVIKSGGLVAFPTETVYGLGANALDSEAAAKIYQAKGRPSDNPLIVHIAAECELDLLVKNISPAAKKLMKAFWPGPLTLVFQKTEAVPVGTTGGLQTVAVRMPAHELALALIRQAGVPVAAPSANCSGRPSPTVAAHVWQDLNGKIDMIVDGGAVSIGLESTIVDVSGAIPVLLRPGAVTVEMIREIIGQMEIDPTILNPLGHDQRPKAPGMKYKHYAPDAELFLVEGQPAQVQAEINRRVAQAEAAGRTAGVLCTDESRSGYPNGVVRSIGRRSQPESVALKLFALLREFDQLEVDIIFSESFTQKELGLAIMNRLMKAAGYQVIQL